MCEKHNKTVVTIYRWIEKGCPHKKVQDGLKMVYEFDEKEVDQWLKSRG